MRTLVVVVVVVMGTLGTPKSKKSKPPSLKRKSKKPRPLEASYLISLGARKLCFLVSTRVHYPLLWVVDLVALLE
jgi:hypothetical protein